MWTKGQDFSLWLTAGADGDWKLQVIKRNHTYFFSYMHIGHFMPESQKSRKQWQKATDMCVCTHTQVLQFI